MKQDSQEIIDKLEAIDCELSSLKEKMEEIKAIILALALGMFACALLVGFGLSIKYAVWLGLGVAAFDESRRRKTR